MWRTWSVLMSFLVLGVYVSFFAPPSETIAVSGQYSPYPYLSTSSKYPLSAITTQTNVTANTPDAYIDRSVDARLAGMLLHIKWLLNEQASTNTQKELERLNKQILALMDNVSDDFSDIRDDFDDNSQLENDSVTPDMLLSSGQVDEYCLTYEGTGTTFEWQACGIGGMT